MGHKKDITVLQAVTAIGTKTLFNALNDVLQDDYLRNNKADNAVLAQRILTELLRRSEAGTLNTIP